MHQLASTACRLEIVLDERADVSRYLALAQARARADSATVIVEVVARINEYLHSKSSFLWIWRHREERLLHLVYRLGIKMTLTSKYSKSLKSSVE